MVRLFPFFILLLSVSVFSQSVKVRSAGKGRARLTSGKLQSVINLSKDVSGCFLTYDITDPKRREYDVTAFDLIDSVKKNGSLYLVLLGSANGNCHIQGQCGAAEDWTLVWLKLSPTLKVLDKKAAIVQSCLYNSIDLESEFDEGKTPLKMVNGELKVEYSENRYQQDLEYKYHTLTYKRSEAEKGFSIVTENRTRPKN
jgi:hypothetical protein